MMTAPPVKKAKPTDEITVPPVWAKRPNESGMQYDAFLIYRELGIQRSSTECARIMGKVPSLIRKWMIKHDWHERVAVWDERVAERRDQAALDEAAEMGKRQARLGMELQKKANERLTSMPATELTVQDTIRMATAGAELERTARGDDSGKESGNIVFNINMPSPPSWAPAKIVDQIQKAITIGGQAANGDAAKDNTP